MDLPSFPPGLKRSAAMVVLQHREFFLLLKRNKPPFQGHYLPVGGKLEPYEDPYSAARRELFEETGIHAGELRYGGVLVETSPLDYNWQSNIYSVEIDWQTPPICDEGTLEWIPFADLERLPTPPTDWHIYQFLTAGTPFALNAIYDQQMQLRSMVEEISGRRLDVSR